MSGADGLLFEHDLEDAIDGLMQGLGYAYSTKRAKQAFLAGVLGRAAPTLCSRRCLRCRACRRTSSTVGLDSMIPGTGLLTKKASYTNDRGEIRTDLPALR